MGRKLSYLLICLFFLLTSCATVPDSARVDKLEEEIIHLKREQLRGFMKMMGETGASFRWRSGRVGGTSNDVDGISCTSLDDGDAIFSIEISGTTVDVYPYIWDDDSTETSTDDPRVIVPTNQASCSNQGAWLLGRLNTIALVGSAPDGEHFLNASNSGQESYSQSDGDCYFRRDRDAWFCYDSTTSSWIAQRNNAIANYTSTTNTIPYTYHYGGTITNFGASGSVEYDLKNAELGMEICFGVASATTMYIDPYTGDRIISDSTITNADGDRLSNSGVIGSHVCLKAYTGTAGDIDWIVSNIRNTWTDAN